VQSVVRFVPPPLEESIGSLPQLVESTAGV
jgi:hypothetical protein